MFQQKINIGYRDAEIWFSLLRGICRLGGSACFPYHHALKGQKDKENVNEAKPLILLKIYCSPVSDYRSNSLIVGDAFCLPSFPNIIPLCLHAVLQSKGNSTYFQSDEQMNSKTLSASPNFTFHLIIQYRRI